MKTKQQRLTKEEQTEVKSLVEDGGYSLAEAKAWVRQFGTTSQSEKDWRKQVGSRP